ncbi:MAG: peptidase dimerization protein [Acidobacteria bacterium RIFCSPLOWO2_12_FULL_54_10]|nr:MAG: peptidase dimerization protein [Acidobacteria bacterium RIFCSPLOWO2_12_FULL_54_10]
MNPFELTRKLIDIESISGNERVVSDFLRDCLIEMGAAVETEEAEPNRPNVFAAWGKPDVVLSTHMDTVPPFIASSEDENFIYGRGACDAKGIIAAQIGAAEQLLSRGVEGFGLLFVVGEERNNAGALAANRNPRGSRYLINGEPTENKLALGTKGVLRVVLEATGRAAHSAYPELGESATEKLLAALNRLRAMDLPTDALLGKTTCNIGLIHGGIAPNVIPSAASAELMYRLVESGRSLFDKVQELTKGLVTVKKVLEIPPVHLTAMEGLETSVVAYATDIPELSHWGQPFLLGPGSIHVAHTMEERISKVELMQAVEIYVNMVKRLKGS